MRYLVCDSLEDAEQISRLLWAVARPERARHRNDVTSRLFQVIEHPSNGTAALCVVEGYSIPIYPSLIVGKEELDIAEKIMPRMTADSLAKLGRRLTTDDLLQATNATVLTEQEAAAAGWFGAAEPAPR